MDKYTPFVVQDTDILGVKCYFIACYTLFVFVQNLSKSCIKGVFIAENRPILPRFLTL